ncbi:glycosyltransferase family 2 protein, partial [Persephonella sp.]
MRKKNEKLPISVALISFNEEDRIADTLDSIRDLASEIILVDSGSKDKTVEIAERFGAKIFRKEWEGYKNQKNYALSKCTNEWILFLDCDEVVSESLKESIINA